jgi:hypothetical protein
MCAVSARRSGSGGFGLIASRITNKPLLQTVLEIVWANRSLPPFAFFSFFLPIFSPFCASAAQFAHSFAASFRCAAVGTPTDHERPHQQWRTEKVPVELIRCSPLSFCPFLRLSPPPLARKTRQSAFPPTFVPTKLAAVWTPNFSCLTLLWVLQLGFSEVQCRRKALHDNSDNSGAAGVQLFDQAHRPRRRPNTSRGAGRKGLHLD